MADVIFESKAKDSQHESSIDWMEHNVINPAINAGPLGIYNTAANLVGLPEAHLAVDKATPYSKEWVAQSAAGGVGAILPFMLASAGAGKLMRGADGLLEGTKVGETLRPLLTSTRAANIAGASLYGALQKPEDGHTRFGNAVGMGLGFLVFDQGNALSKSFSPVGKAFAYPLTGMVGGAVMSEGSQLFSNGKLASGDTVMQSAIQGATLNTGFALAHAGLEAATKEKAPVVPTDKAPVGNDTTALGHPAMADLARTAQAYSDFVRQNRVQYPAGAAEHSTLTPEEIVNRGFYHPDAKNLDQLAVFHEHGGHPRPLPPAGQVASEVTKSVADMPMAGKNGDIILGEWNMEFLTGDKAKYFADSYKQIVPRHHLLWVEETNEDGLKQIAQDNGYNYIVGRANSRGQAVGFLINPRFKVLGTQQYEDVANVFNIPDERPALRVDLQDTTTGQKLSAIGVHLKSMMGGEEKTSPVRTEQARRLANDLGNNFSGLIAGDWNTFLDNTHDLDPLKQNGFQVLNPGDHTSTQAMGGRLDGFLYKNLGGQFSQYQVRPFFKDPLITRGLSDHGLVTTHFAWDSSSQTPSSFAHLGAAGTAAQTWHLSSGG